MARALVSKTRGCGSESHLSCHKYLPATNNGNKMKTAIDKNVLADTIRGLGVVATDPKSLIKAATNVIADKIEGNARSSLLLGLNYLNKEGRIASENFIESPRNRHFLTSIDRDFDAYKNDELKLGYKVALFLGIISGEISASDIELRRIWRLVDGLTDQGTVLLATCYRLCVKTKNDKLGRYEVTVDDWIDIMASESGLNHYSFVEEAEHELINKWLLRGREGNTIVSTNNCRLTDLGILVSRLIEKGNIILDKSQSTKR